MKKDRPYKDIETKSLKESYKVLGDHPFDSGYMIASVVSSTKQAILIELELRGETVEEEL